MGRILAIETSCDESAVAIVARGEEILSNLVASQIAIHAPFGGVVPEIACRQHLLSLNPLIRQALRQADLGWEQIDALAVTQGPGLVGALLVGVSTAKALAWALGKPLLAVNHLAGHIYANMLTGPVRFPALCLVVSGGHTDLILMEKDNEFRLLGQTRDDAVGEAFDKIARVLGLPYPGGPEIDALARQGRPSVPFPRTMLEEGSLDFSFSGLKTAVINHVHTCRQRGTAMNAADIAASFQGAAAEVLVEKTSLAIERTGPATLLMAGGVAANSHLRRVIQELAIARGLPLKVPPLELCTDNAAMIGAAAWPLYKAGQASTLSLNARPDLPL